MISFNALMVVFINLAVLLNGAKGSGRFFEGIFFMFVCAILSSTCMSCKGN